MHLDAPLQRITTWLAILGYVLVASGLPLPLGVIAPAASDSVAAKRIAGKDRSKPFPCMDKACGCATAEQCFTSCCCNTPAETLVWAKAHQIEPAVLRTLENRVSRAERDRLNIAKATPGPGCCSVSTTESEPSCCAIAAAAAESESALAIGSDDPLLAALPAATDDVPSEDKSIERPQGRLVTLRAMLACGGIVAEWFAAGVALPPPRVEVSLTMSVRGVCTPADEAGECLRPSPAAPPPRAA